MAQHLKTDRILFTTTVLMVFFGVVMIYSASSVMAELKMGSSYHFAMRQVFWVVLGIAAMMVLRATDYRRLQHPAVAFTTMGVLLMLLTLVYLVDSRQHRWIRLPLGGIQPSELAKPALALFLAYLIATRSRAINDKHTVVPAAMSIGIVIVSIAVADLGTAIVLMVAAAAVFFVAGLEWKYCVIAAAVGLLAVVFFICSKPYRLARVVGYMDPGFKIISGVDHQGRLKGYLQRSLSTRDTNYQAEQAKIAVGSGGPLGVGLMQGKQKLLYLPEAHTDTIYAVAGEEWGLAGTVGLLLGFGIILWRGIRAAVLIPDEFGRYLALCITVILVVQAFMNMSVVLGMAPTKGIPLPMISFGGSSLVSTLVSLGILMNISEHAG